MIRLGLAYVFFLMGWFPILAGVGLLRLEKPIEPLAMPVAILFGGVFVAIGVAIVWSPLHDTARARGATTALQVRSLVWRLLRGRASKRSAVAASNVFLLALTCALVLVGVDLPLVGNQETVAQVVTLEFLTIHAFPFLVVLATFWGASSGSSRVALGVFMTAVGGIYGVGAWALGGGPWGVVWLLYLWIPNATPFLGGRGKGDARVLAVSRWCIKLWLFLTVVMVLGGGDFQGPGTVAVGMVYFGCMSVLDLLRVAEIPGDLAAEWGKVGSFPWLRVPWGPDSRS